MEKVFRRSTTNQTNLAPSYRPWRDERLSSHWSGIEPPTDHRAATAEPLTDCATLPHYLIHHSIKKRSLLSSVDKMRCMLMVLLNDDYMNVI
ncbi:hypothetical protein RB195_009151 [Necator americanus]|uniref:Uncharacterized protein n=1 Tax=Necator americanus TaxID=51031 RepID=A0ABR1CUJ9_NECAM